MLKFACLLVLFACGTDKTVEYLPPTTGPSKLPPRPSTGPATYAEVSGYLQASCGAAGCHKGAGFLASEAALKASTQAKNRIQNGSMPPAYAANYSLWEDGIRKNKVLSFLGN